MLFCCKLSPSDKVDTSVDTPVMSSHAAVITGASRYDQPCSQGENPSTIQGFKEEPSLDTQRARHREFNTEQPQRL